MSPDELIDRLEQAPDAAAARTVLRPWAKTPGLSGAYFRRVATRLAEDPSAARRLANRWRILAKFGDDPAQAHRIHGVAERLRGRWEASLPAFQEAGRQARSAADALAFRVAEIESLGRLGRTDEALRLARRIVKGLRAVGEPALAARARLNAAAALLWVDDYVRAAAWLTLARDELDRAGMDFEAAGARMSLSTCRLHDSQPTAAIALAREAREAFDTLGLAHMVALCDSNLAQAALQLGRPDEALGLLLELRDRYSGSPIDQARTEEFIGHAYSRLNLPDEAEIAFEAALRHPGMRSLPVNQANCRLGQARAALSQGRSGKARTAARLAAAAYRRFGNPVWEAVATLVEAQATLDKGQEELALALASAARDRLAEQRAAFALAEAEIILAQAEWRGGIDPAPRLQVAERLIRREGRLGLEWRVFALRAQSAPEAKRRRHYRRMVDAMIQARAQLSSSAGKVAFLNDKAEALRSYLGDLLRRPNAKSVAEALDVIRRTRAAALADEILAAAPSPEGVSFRADLEALRVELAQLESPADGATSRGSSLRTIRGAPKLARKWLELTWQLAASGSAAAPEPDKRTVVFTASTAGLHGIRAGKSRSLGPASAMAERLRWMKYELFEAQACPDASPDRCLEALESFAELFAPLWPGTQAVRVLAPEADLWSVPWAGVAAAFDRPFEPVLALAPGFGRDAEAWKLGAKPRVVVWKGSHPDLPQIDREVADVLEAFPDAMVLESARDVYRMLDGAKVDLLHVASHARLHAAQPMFSYLQFPDGRIRAAEIARSCLRLEFVTLSACDTGNLVLSSPHEPQGMVRAFLACGARLALASQWSLDDAASADLVRTFCRQICQDENIVAALSRARLDLRRRRPHPYFWASMTLFGGYRN